jgi:hypothetical protein
MLEFRKYNTEQLAEALGISVNTLKLKRKVTEERHLSKYIWSKEGRGKNVVYKIEGLKETNTNSLIDTFYSLLEDFSGQEVHFKNPETAIKILYYLYQRNENIAFFISRDLGISEKTVRNYITRFRKLGLLVGYWDCFNIDGKEVEKHVLSPDQYDYYQVVDGVWHETNLHGWLDAWAFRKNAYEQYVEEIENETGWQITEEQEKIVKTLANKLMIEEFGEQRRVEHKYLNEDAKLFLGSFLVYAAKKLGLSFEKKEQKSKEYINSLYQRRALPKNTNDEVVLDDSYAVVDVGRKHVGDFEEWLMQQQEKQESFQIGFIQKPNVIQLPRKMSFKELTEVHEYMQIQDVKEIAVEDVKEKELRIEEDPFTGQLLVFNEQTRKWEKYIESEWVNGKKVEPEVIVIPDIPVIKFGTKSLALDEMLRSAI